MVESQREDLKTLFSCSNLVIEMYTATRNNRNHIHYVVICSYLQISTHNFPLMLGNSKRKDREMLWVGDDSFHNWLLDDLNIWEAAQCCYRWSESTHRQSKFAARNVQYIWASRRLPLEFMYYLAGELPLKVLLKFFSPHPNPVKRVSLSKNTKYTWWVD